jgi:hypothetical protein
MLCLIIRYFFYVEINLGFQCCNYMFLIQLMLFMESIRFELEKLEFKLIVELLAIFNNIV